MLKYDTIILIFKEEKKIWLESLFLQERVELVNQVLQQHMHYLLQKWVKKLYWLVLIQHTI